MWEYRVFQTTLSYLQSNLDDAGREGWELVSSHVHNIQILLIFKRKK